MTTPTERLEVRKLRLHPCKVCNWLSSLSGDLRDGWLEAIGNPRYGQEIVADEAQKDGATFGRDAVKTHRERGHTS